jgi:hypothetical protein
VGEKTGIFISLGRYLLTAGEIKIVEDFGK